MALFRLYFVQSLCVLLYLFLEQNHFLTFNVDVNAEFIGTPSLENVWPSGVEPDPFQKGWQPPRGIRYNDTYYLDLLKSEWCPGIGSCKKHNAILNDPVCCLPCSCSEDCLNIGNCCYDKYDLDSDVVTSREICDFTGILGTKTGLNRRTADSVDDFYLFIDSCDGGNKGIETYKCRNPNFQNLTEITPVYDPVSGHNYKNMFCAVCNHVATPLVKWLPKLVNYNKAPHLINILQNKEIIFEDIHLPLKVSVIWIPHKINFTTCVGQSFFVSSCKIPMLTTELLSNLCQSITMPVKFGVYIYKNMYCIFCSVYNFDNCKKNPTRIPVGQSFAFFLNYDTIATNIDATPKSPSRCNPDLTYIDDLGECLKIYCGCSKMKIKDQCLPVMDNISGISLHFRIKIMFLASQYSDTTLRDIKGFTIALIATNQFELEEKNVCYQINSTAELYEHIVFEIKVAVQLPKYTLSVQDYYTTFITKLNLTKVNPSRSSLQELGIIDVSQGDFGYDTLALDYVNFATFTEKSGVCGYGLAMTNLQFCNSVRINTFVYADNNQINITFSGKNVTFKWSEYLIRHGVDGHVAQICLDTYVLRISPQSSSVSSIRETSTLILVIVLFVTSCFVDSVDTGV